MVVLWLRGKVMVQIRSDNGEKWMQKMGMVGRTDGERERGKESSCDR